MILTDQPNIFGDNLLCAVSSRNDGSMLNRVKGIHADEVVANRKVWLQSLGISYDDVIYQVIQYDEAQKYDAVVRATGADVMSKSGHGLQADAVICDTPGVYVLLPVADCVATCVYDPVHAVFAVLHMGRHSTVTELIMKTMTEMSASYGTKASDCRVYMSPAAGKDSYKMKYFDQSTKEAWRQFIVQKNQGIYLDLRGYNQERFIECGVPKENIEISNVDTMTSPDYFSHSQGDVDGRVAMVVGIPVS